MNRADPELEEETEKGQNRATHAPEVEDEGMLNRNESGALFIEITENSPDLEEEEATASSSNSTSPDLERNRGADLERNRGEIEHRSAIACICRDHRGCLVDGFVKTIKVASAEQVEAVALLETLDFLSNCPNKDKDFEVHSDSLTLVQAVEEETTPNWEVAVLVDRIREKRKKLPGLTLTHCSRDANRPVDWLARAQRQHYLPPNRLTYPPIGLIDLLSADVITPNLSK